SPASSPSPRCTTGSPPPSPICSTDSVAGAAAATATHRRGWHGRRRRLRGATGRPEHREQAAGVAVPVGTGHTVVGLRHRAANLEQLVARQAPVLVERHLSRLLVRVVGICRCTETTNAQN